MGNYIARPRDDHAASPGRWNVLETLLPEHAFWLPANNAEARIAFAEIAVEHVLAHEDIRLGPVCFVTITPANCAFPVGDEGPDSRKIKAFHRCIGLAARFNIHVLQQIARQGMGDVPFVGMIEAALYHRWSPSGRTREYWVSWHCHLLAWGRIKRSCRRRSRLCAAAVAACGKMSQRCMCRRCLRTTSPANFPTR